MALRLASTLAVAAVIALNAPALAQAPLAAQGCLGCHGPNGAGQAPIPALTGRPATETEALLRVFRANERPATIMGRIARGYTDAEIAAVSAHFAAQR